MSKIGTKKFEFTIEGMTEDQADKLLDHIVEFVESEGLEMGGGVHFQEDDDGQEESGAAA